MRLFGRKANQQSATEVPPELQQYYNKPTWRSRFRRAGLFILPVLAFLVLVGALIGGALWLRHHKLSDIPRVLSRQTQKAPTHSAPKPSQQRSSTQKSVPTHNDVTPAPSESTQDTTPSQQSSPTPTQTQDQTPSSPASQPATIPNTGPNEVSFEVAMTLAVVGTAASYARQLRKMRA